MKLFFLDRRRTAQNVESDIKIGPPAHLMTHQWGPIVRLPKLIY